MHPITELLCDKKPILACVENTKNMAGTGVMQHLWASELMPDWMSAEHKTGTTIMAVEFADGVVIAADSRTTTG